MTLVASLALPLATTAPQTPSPAPPQPAPPSRASQLRGEYGRYRANNDLLSYRLDVRVNPVEPTASRAMRE